MEDFVLSVLIIQGLCALAVLAGSAADALIQRTRQPREWAALPAPAFPVSVYERQEADQDIALGADEPEVFPRAA